ncbi:MAG: sugar ABC transporter ATP-binding protein [Anaerolineae bacterium]|nr:sugar ABC transporter ATP-binding protein [Anaerolineae bacterium]
MNQILLETHGISKSFPGEHALKDINFDIQPGEVHILLGENGAGKSTLINILSGVYPPDTGHLLFKGQEVVFTCPADAQQVGISAIFQEPNLIPYMSVAENIFLGNEPGRGMNQIIDKTRLVDRTLELIDELNLALDPETEVSELSLAEKQMVAVLRTINQSADLVIMDEPSAMLTNRETSQLHSVIRRMRSQGAAVLYVTHHLSEAMQIGNRATILRDGRKIATVAIDATSQHDLIRLITGHKNATRRSSIHRPHRMEREVLRLENVSTATGIDNVSFSLHAGEILGITGLIGAGGTRLFETVFGVEPLLGGEIYLDGNPVTIDSPQVATRLGIGWLTEERREQGLVLEMDAQNNMTLAVLRKLGIGPILNLDEEGSIVAHYAQRLGIKVSSLTRRTRELSGGTQQKVILSRWLASSSRVLLIDQPTRGLDIQARGELYDLLNDLARRGIGIIVISSNIDEILNLSDRIIILRKGRIIDILSKAEANPYLITALSSEGV